MASTTQSADIAETKEKADLAVTTDQSDDEIDPVAENQFRWRLDLGFLTIGFLSYMFKYIDQINISNAYVSGMQTDLHLYGNELNYFTTFFNIGYMIMLFPSCILISHIGPAIWLPSCELIWGVLTCCLSLVTDARQVYGIRFFIGFCEATMWPAYFTMISQWYMPNEVALRMSIYNMAQPAGAMLSGAMQGALSTNLEGHMNRSGWRWAFIINGVCTIVVALLGYVLLPGYPERPNKLASWYLRRQDYDVALARSRRIGREPQRGLTVKSFIRAFTFWELWAVAIAWPFGGNTAPTSYFNLYLQSLKNSDGTLTYSVAMLNYLPIIGQAVQLVAELLFSGFSDLTGQRLPFLVLHSAISLTSLSIIIARPQNRQLHMAGYYLNYIGDVSMMLLCAWASDHLRGEPEVRTLLFATGTIIFYALSAFLPIAAFPASEAPNWKIGAKPYLGFAVASLLMFIGIHIGFKREARKRELKEESKDQATLN
ncbi:unnamed protein product [Clonostachys rosea f. rosea IK726]|uniref:Uncharacterized protein n=1 Tax=Clonostachys rosea f. rosea IK726 TaxID=1349383 RepID=A0ACA9UAQ9_BIOOC|nr:unnamed protein product [Clonostachys rosea f. rosea IK726]